MDIERGGRCQPAPAPPVPTSRTERMIRPDRGAVATEYAILTAFIVVIVAVGIAAYGDALLSYFNAIASKISGALS